VGIFVHGRKCFNSPKDLMPQFKNNAAVIERNEALRERQAKVEVGGK
jgi:hypothetical protein